MKNRIVYNSMFDIKLEKEKLRFEILLYEEKMKNLNSQMISGLSVSMKNLSFNVTNRLISYSLLRSLYKTRYLYDFLMSFSRGFGRFR